MSELCCDGGDAQAILVVMEGRFFPQVSGEGLLARMVE